MVWKLISVRDKGSASARPLILGIIGSNVFGLVVAGIYESLSLNGVVNSRLSFFVLVFSWIIGVLGIVLSETVWGKGMRHRLLTGIGSATALSLLLFALNIGSSRLAEAQSNQNGPIGTSADQGAGQTAGVINNNGPVYNEPSPKSEGQPCSSSGSTLACIQTSGGGTVKGIHFYDTQTCADRLLAISGDGHTEDVTFNKTRTCVDQKTDR
jgi:hypothetical protein